MGNPIKEYGFKGKVKSVTTINYIDLESSNGKWIISPDKLNSKWKMSFNKNGNIIEMTEYSPVSNTIWEDITSIIEFKNGKKSNFTKTDSFGKQVENGNYEWIDNYHYSVTSTESYGMKMESHSTLNEAFRDLSGDYTYSFSDSIYYAESYVNQLNNEGEIISSKFTDLLTNESHVIKYLNKEIDKKGNLVKIALVYESNGKLKRLSIREFEYFK